MLQVNKTSNKKYSPNDIFHLLQDSMIEEINIYNQAHLHQSCPLVESHKPHNKTKNEIALQFSIQGEFEGKAVCLLDTYEKQTTHIKPLFKESMNILLGDILTQLERKHDIFSLIDTPKELEDLDFSKDFRMNRIYSITYKLLQNFEEYDCRIIFSLNQKRLIEV